MLHVVDDLLQPQHFAYAQAKFSSIEIPWFYLPFTANPRDLDHLAEYAGSFSHLVYKDDEPASPLAEAAIHILLSACDRLAHDLDRVIRIRLGMSTRTPRQIQHTPHRDQQYPHRAAIWYPITASGDTVIFEETEPSRRYTECYRCSPVANRWLDFPGEHMHSSTTPDQHEQRIVLNFNYTVRGMPLPPG
jgi:hypothetical protein